MMLPNLSLSAYMQLTIAACWIVYIVYWVVSAWSVKAVAERQSRAAMLSQRIPIALGAFLLFARFGPTFPLEWVLFQRPPAVKAVAAALCLLGVAGAIWARRTLAGNWSGAVTFKKGHELVKTGPYRYVRHPIYTSLLLMFLGTALEAGRLGACLGVLVFLGGCLIKISQEEKLMMRHFPDEYAQYRASVKALIPFIL